MAGLASNYLTILWFQHNIDIKWALLTKLVRINLS
jgi:hypothetical protein